MFLSWRWISSKNRIQITVATAADKISSAGHHRIGDEPGAWLSFPGSFETSGAALTGRVLSAISGAGKPRHHQPGRTQERIKLSILSPRGTSGERIEEPNKNAPPLPTLSSIRWRRGR